MTEYGKLGMCVAMSKEEDEPCVIPKTEETEQTEETSACTKGRAENVAAKHYLNTLLTQVTT